MVPWCWLNTLDPVPPMVPVAVPLSPLLDFQARPDPPPALDLLPTPRPIIHTIKGNSLSPWHLPSRKKWMKCHCQAPLVPKSLEERTSPNSSWHTKGSPLELGPTQHPKMLSQPSHTTARKRSSKQSHRWTENWGKYEKSRKKNIRIPSVLYSSVFSSRPVCASRCEGVCIESCEETCRIDIRLIDDSWRQLQKREITS